MLSVKKLISFFISLTFIFNIFLPTRTFALDLYDDCSQINDSNVYCCDDYKCRVDKDILNSGKDYVFIRKFGTLTNAVNRYTSFKDLDRVFEMYKLEPTSQLIKELNNLRKVSNNYSDFKNLLRIIVASLIGAISGHFFSELKAHNKVSRVKNLQNSDVNRAPVKISILTNIACSIGAGIAGVASLIYSNIKGRSIFKKLQVARDEYDKVYDLNNKKQYLLNLMLHDIEKSDYYSNENEKDAFLIGVNEGEFTFDSCLLGLDFTEEEKTTLPGRLKKLASEIRKNLEEHKVLSDYNKIGDERENQYEAIQSDN